jgi:molecular chaperone HscB
MMDFNADHFALFDLPRAFRIDTAVLDERYRDIQAQVHPDKFADADEAQRRRSLQWATKANEAYQSLKKPLSRALYLLTLCGNDINMADNHAMPIEFLMEQMEWREAVAEARAGRALPELEELEHRVRGDIRKGYEALAAVLDDQRDYAQGADRVRRLMFLEKLLADIDEALTAVDA